MSATVFIVEDDVDTREMLGRFLELEGYRVETAANGKLALERLGSGVGPCVILLDLMMPVMDGWQFRQAQIHNTALADIPVIVVSAAGRDRIERIQADAYLSKPVDLDELLGCVTQFCRP
ncbi:MAG: response regulator [Vicinamibacterales bacterium]